MDCVVHGVTKSQTRLSDFHYHSLSLSRRRKECPPPLPSFLESHLDLFPQEAGPGTGEAYDGRCPEDEDWMETLQGWEPKIAAFHRFMSIRC